MAISRDEAMQAVSKVRAEALDISAFLLGPPRGRDGISFMNADNQQKVHK
jgi:hypothetical protein